jgi:hypothetical protein
MGPYHPAHPRMPKMARALPMLCECQRLEGCVEHRDMHSTYVLWVMRSDASHAVFLHRQWLDALVYTDGRTFLELLSHLPPEDCCKMISRTLLGALKYKPDYIVVVSEADAGTPWASGLSMGSALLRSDPDLASVRAVAEGPAGANNFLGRRLSELCQVLADKGFFEDPKNRRFLSKALGAYFLVLV